MPAAITSGKFYEIVTNIQAQILLEQTAFYEAYTMLDSIGTPGTVNDTYWTSPEGIQFHYKNGISEIELNGNKYSSCNSETKRKGYKHLDQFIVYTMNKFTIDYNL